MPTCTLCGTHYKATAFNQSNRCLSCIDDDTTFYDEETKLDVDRLVNPSGKIAPVFDSDTTSYDDDNGFGF